MAIAMRGLRLRPTYEDLVGVAVSDGLEHMKFTHRNAAFFKKWFCSESTWRRRDEGDGNAATETH